MPEGDLGEAGHYASGSVLRPRMIGALIAAAAVLAGARAGAGELHGSLTAEKERVRVGETLRVLITVKGSGPAAAWKVEQPSLPKLKRFELADVSQRNEVESGEKCEAFSISFLYLLKALSAGEERIPEIAVKYQKGGEKGSVTVGGTRIQVAERRGAKAAVYVLLFLIAGLAAALIVIHRRGARRRPAQAASIEPPVAGRRSEAAARALARMEDARRLKLSGEMSAYSREVAKALSGYAEEEGEIADLTGRIAELSERVKYGGDEEAEREMQEIARRAELFFKGKIREELRIAGGEGD